MVKSQLFVGLGLLVFLAPGLGLAQSKGDAKAGKAKYDANCVGCHGATGKGDGAAAAALNPKPGDMTDGKAMKALSDKYYSISSEWRRSQKISDHAERQKSFRSGNIDMVAFVLSQK
jgi:cytochrome c553